MFPCDETRLLLLANFIHIIFYFMRKQQMHQMSQMSQRQLQRSQQLPKVSIIKGVDFKYLYSPCMLSPSSYSWYPDTLDISLVFIFSPACIISVDIIMQMISRVSQKTEYRSLNFANELSDKIPSAGHPLSWPSWEIWLKTNLTFK